MAQNLFLVGSGLGEKSKQVARNIELNNNVLYAQAHGAVVVAEALQDGATGGKQPAAQAAGHAGIQVQS